MYHDKINCDIRNKLLSELIADTSPRFSKNPRDREQLLAHPDDYNLTRLVEKSLAHASDGLYKFIDEAHKDNDDGSEDKTATIYKAKRAKYIAAWAEITNVRSEYGRLKEGALRCVILNPFLEKLHFIFIPKDAVKQLMTTKDGNDTKSKSAYLTYNLSDESFTKCCERYGLIEVSTFKQLAKIKNH